MPDRTSLSDDADRLARETRLRERHPHLGGFLEAMQEPPLDNTPFRVGQLGDVAVATSVAERSDDRSRSLHDRRIPGGGADIDRLAVAPTGVYVIETDDVSGTVTVDASRPGEPKLHISGVNRTRYFDDLDRQVAAVRAALDEAGHAAVAVQGVLCFTRAELPESAAGEVHGHLLTYRRPLAKQLNAGGPLDPDDIAVVQAVLAAALPAA